MRVLPLTRALALATATSLAALTAALGVAPTYASTTRTIVGQGAYLCESKPVGLPYETYNVTLRMSLTAPASVSPGQTVSLSGTATLQFPEKAYQEGKSIGETEADGYSDTLSVATSFNGRVTDVAANRWQTAPFPWSDPVVISAPITIHSFTVPANASGALTITLPRNQRAAPNTASSSPATVAFNGVANNRTAAGNIAEKLGCYLQGTAPSVIASIPIATSAAAAGSASRSTTASGTSAGTPPVVTSLSGSGQSAAPVSGASSNMSQSPSGASTVNGTTPATGSAPMMGQAGYATAPVRSGVFISTDVLIILGALVCLAALAYAFLMQYRLRSIKQAMDGQ